MLAAPDEDEVDVEATAGPCLPVSTLLLLGCDAEIACSEFVVGIIADIDIGLCGEEVTVGFAFVFATVLVGCIGGLGVEISVGFEGVGSEAPSGCSCVKVVVEFVEVTGCWDCAPV